MGLRTIMGHCVSDELRKLFEEVECAFPSKRLLIHPYKFAERESGKQVKPKAKAVSMPEIDDYIAIWIKQNLPTDEFNAVLAEEALHHLQAKEGWSEIRGLNLYLGSSAKSITDNLTSTIFDLGAHQEMMRRRINLKPLLQDDMIRIKQAIRAAKGSSQTLRKLKGGRSRRCGFPDYLLWWFNLYALGIKPYRNEWKRKIRPWFDKHVNPNVMKEWDSLTGFVLQFSTLDANSARRIIVQTCQVLFGCNPILGPRGTSGRLLKCLLLNELIPPK